MSVLLFVFLGLCVALFLPIFLETSVYYDVNKRKFSFSVELYRCFRLLGGYIATYKGGIAIHTSRKKAIVIPYYDLDKERKRFSFIRIFKLKSLLLTMETGAEYLLPINIAHMIVKMYFFVKCEKKSKIVNNLWLYDGDILRISLQSEVLFN